MIASTKVTEQAESRWAKIVERFRAACVLYKEGDEGESRRIIKEELPGLIRSWIKLLPSSLKSDAKADKLLQKRAAIRESVLDEIKGGESSANLPENLRGAASAS